MENMKYVRIYTYDEEICFIGMNLITLPTYTPVWTCYKDGSLDPVIYSTIL